MGIKKNIEVDIICIGDELLIGQTINTNAAWIGSEVNHWGMKVRRAISIADDQNQIIQEIDHSLNTVAVTFLTGGLGPTKDDITKKTICEYFNDHLIEDQGTLDRVKSFFESRKLPMLGVNAAQALIPSRCHVLPNFHGTAPGMWLEKNGNILISMPGVPYEMQGLMKESVYPKIIERFSLPIIFHKTLVTVGVGESFIAEQLKNLEPEIAAAGISLAYLPSPGLVKLRLSSYGHAEDSAFENTIEEFVEKIKRTLGDMVFAEEDISIQESISKLMKGIHKTLSVAESCTGGNIQSWLTGIEGASEFFNGGVTAYLSNAKKDVLQIPLSVLQENPIVSEAVAAAMASASKALFHSDYALSTTGYAGPGNEDSEIPVGTICIGLATPTSVITKTFQLGKNRDRNIRMASLHALNLLRLNILNN
jgi:nicotinamide-nucleotide amidase